MLAFWVVLLSAVLVASGANGSQAVSTDIGGKKIFLVSVCNEKEEKLELEVFGPFREIDKRPLIVKSSGCKLFKFMGIRDDASNPIFHVKGERISEILTVRNDKIDNSKNIFSSIILFFSGVLAALSRDIFSVFLKPIVETMRIWVRYKNARRMFIVKSDEFSRTFEMDDKLLNLARGGGGENWFIRRRFSENVIQLVDTYHKWKSGEVDGSAVREALQ